VINIDPSSYPNPFDLMKDESLELEQLQIRCDELEGALRLAEAERADAVTAVAGLLCCMGKLPPKDQLYWAFNRVCDTLGPEDDDATPFRWAGKVVDANPNATSPKA
jgi:hypothetical protein